MKTNPIPHEAEHSLTIYDSYCKAKSVLEKHDSAYCSVSGGKDSDCMMDIIWRLDAEHKVKYAWFNTGIEYEATKRHLDDLEAKYEVKIDRVKPVKSVPQCCKEYGQPFVSKNVSMMISNMQKKDFVWQDMPFEEAVKALIKGRGGIYLAKWWTNYYHMNKENRSSMWNVSRNKGLKEFLIANSPQFKVSNQCCVFAKKATAKKYEKENNIELTIVGVRKAEGGVRMGVYKNCYSAGEHAQYRPLFWYKNKDVNEYSKIFNIRHSDCYEVYGLKRTGCVGCPYNLKLFDELAIIQKYEPKLYKVCNFVFKDSYEYTRKYRKFQEENFLSKQKSESKFVL